MDSYEFCSVLLLTIPLKAFNSPIEGRDSVQKPKKSIDHRLLFNQDHICLRKVSMY